MARCQREALRADAILSVVARVLVILVRSGFHCFVHFRQRLVYPLESFVSMATERSRCARQEASRLLQ